MYKRQISNRFLEIFGYTREEIKQKFDNKYLNMVHPNDRNKVRRSIESVRGKKNEINTEYRMLSKKGYIWVVDQSRFMEIDGKRLIPVSYTHLVYFMGGFINETCKNFK